MSTRTYGKKSAKRKLDTEPESESCKRPKIDSTALSSTPKATRNFSHILDTALSPSAPSTPTRLVKRMLGRSKTESSLGDPKESSSSSSKSLLDRTSSLPSLASPTKSSLPSPSTSVVLTSSSPQRPAIINKRTYAGKSRSFLVAMPADQSLPEELQDDYNSRESYAVLRNRWGVDNSEDDPYPDLPSPSKSNTTTPTGSPLKGKGKGRLKQEINALANAIQPLRSITEIRNKGENRRFMDEVGYLLEGMGKDETSALQKASALEIVSRLCEPDFIRQAKAADFLQSTWDAFIEAGGGKGEDQVFDALLVAFAALVSRDLVSLTDLAQRDHSPSSSTSSQRSFVTTLFSLVACLLPDADPLLIISRSSTPDGQLKSLGIMKTDRAVLKTLHTVMTSQARIFPSITPISNALLLTHTLAAVPVELLSYVHVSPLLRSLRAQLQPAIDGVNVKPSPSKITPTGSSTSKISSTLHLIPFSAIHDLLALLDSHLLEQWEPLQEPDQEKCHRLLDEARGEWLADGLVAVGVTAELSASRPESKNKHKLKAPSRCTEIVFRVLVSLTHSDPLWSQTLTNNSQAVMFIVRAITAKATIIPKAEDIVHDDKMADYVSSEEGDMDQPTGATEQSLLANALDRLCLSLGLLTNLVQVVDEAKTILRSTMLDPDCIHKTLPCFPICSCRRRMSLVQILVATYEHQLPIIDPASVNPTKSVMKSEFPKSPLALKIEQQQEAEADVYFLLGHLSVLFGLLMMDSPQNQEIVLDALPLLHEDTELSSSTAIRRKQQKLAQLVENASELGVFYAVISRRGLSGNGMATGAPDSRQSHTENDAARGADVAKGVISFLRNLHGSF
ncbi:hypothetical protein J3R30DRAFT_3295167 [Lentinula aciculospora]|uniref:Wings apart-like protein C-terminal domain-containing protein n=1 Tax=Lentinula aciculospora TaxID=153920 RepID=A0A9W9A7Z7_9AGAR|nr:hypothetical protein J3R30DRAFT_3295167 [Lentinula aciculospora]